MAKIQPAVKTLLFGVPAHEGVGTTTHYIDLSECASRVNRRFYRQGLNWAVGGISIYVEAAATGEIVFYKLPDTWMVSNAWHKTYAAWKRQQDEAIEEAGAESTVAKYRDFKIFADPSHVIETFPANLDPIDVNGVPFLPGEWEHSQVVIPNEGGVIGNTQERSLHMVGADSLTSYGMISNYSLSRAHPFSPDPAISPGAPDASFLSEMFNVGMDDVEVLNNVTERNNDLPYDQDNYPGGGVNAGTMEFHDGWSNPGTNSVSNQKHFRGSNFPCGLIRIENSINGATSLVLHMVPGMHRGYLAEPMQDM